MKRVEEKHKVDMETLKTYEQIDGIAVIEALLLHKGEHSPTTETARNW